MLIKNVNPNQLQNEFTANNIATISLVNDRKDGYIAENTWVEFAEDTDMDLVQQIVANHKPQEIKVSLSQEEKIKQLEETINELAKLLKAE